MGRTWKTSIKVIQKIKLGKNADFMPSNTDLAPSNNWTNDIGWPGNEALDNVWPRDDGENYYSPKDDRPREKSVWWKLLNMFKKQQPLGKKDTVPVKEAAGDLTKFILNDREIKQHFKNRGLSVRDILNTLPNLKIQYISEDDPQFQDSRGFYDDENEELQIHPNISKDDQRLTIIHELEHALQGKGKLLSSPEEAEKVEYLERPEEYGARLQQFNALKARKVSLDSIEQWFRRHYPNRPKEEIHNEIMQMNEISEKMLPESIMASKQAKQWVTPKEQVNQSGMNWYWANYIYNYVDENWQDLLHDWLNLDPKNYVKPAILIESIYKDENGKVTAQVHVEFINTAAQSDAYMKFVITGDVHYKPSYEPEGVDTVESLENLEMEVLDYGVKDELEKTSEQLINIGNYDDADILVPEDLLNKYIATISSHYKGLSEQEAYEMDLERSYLHKQLINYVLKNTLSGGLDIKYDKDVTFSIDQLISDFAEAVAYRENYPRETEKESSYGPTNYRGPSVDTGYTYQDSPYNMNVTYSPEEMAENERQNGSGGYPNRFFVKNNSPYYSNTPEIQILKTLKCPHCGSNDVEESNG